MHTYFLKAHLNSTLFSLGGDDLEEKSIYLYEGSNELDELLVWDVMGKN